MMNLSLYLHTIRFLRIEQIFYQLLYRILKIRYKSINAPHSVDRTVWIDFIPKPRCKSDGNFSFLNITEKFNTWNDTRHGMLWAYNLNYMDWLCQEGASRETGEKWIDKFITDLLSNRVGLDPYPIALRGINWIKFISVHYDAIPENKRRGWNDSLYSQYRMLSRKLEYHLEGNHLLEDAYSLFIASIYFADRRLYKKASKLLIKELDEQILPDGAHYEQSPMYHCILLDRLLDCYNISSNQSRFDDQSRMNEVLAKQAKKMLGHLESLIYADRTIPLLNDSAYGIAPSPEQLFDYARRLGIHWDRIPMKECGYRKLSGNRMEAIVDVGNITASYQPGHSHADTFGYELRVLGQPLLIDTGISTYDKNRRRQLERSTMAHNTVTVNDSDSSEVWSGFRVGRRARVSILEEDPIRIVAEHNGFGRTCTHRRTFRIEPDVCEVTDSVTDKCATAKNYLHFAPNIKILSYDLNRIVTDNAQIVIEGADRIEIIDGKASSEYNRLSDITIAVLHFTSNMKYQIIIEKA